MYRRMIPAAICLLTASVPTTALSADSESFSQSVYVTNKAPDAADVKERRINLTFRVVRIDFSRDGEPVSKGHVVKSKTQLISRNAVIRRNFIWIGKVQKDGTEVQTPLPSSRFTTRQTSTGLASAFYEFSINTPVHINDDDSVALTPTVRLRGAFPTFVHWPEANRREVVTAGERQIMPGRATRIAGVTTAANLEIRSAVRRGEAPPPGEAHTAYYLEVISEVAPPEPTSN